MIVGTPFPGVRLGLHGVHRRAAGRWSTIAYNTANPSIPAPGSIAAFVLVLTHSIRTNDVSWTHLSPNDTSCPTVIWSGKRNKKLKKKRLHLDHTNSRPIKENESFCVSVWCGVHHPQNRPNAQRLLARVPFRAPGVIVKRIAIRRYPVLYKVHTHYCHLPPFDSVVLISIQ